MSDPVRFKYITTGMLIFHAAYSYYVNHAESSLLVNDFLVRQVVAYNIYHSYNIGQHYRSC